MENKVLELTNELIEVRQELETFGYTISHDLQTPLRAINIFVQVLLEDYGDKLDATGKRYLQSIDNSSNEMSLLITGLLYFSRLATVELIKKEVRMSSIVKKVINQMKLDKGTVSFEMSFTEEEEVYCDSNLIKSVWVNLISNAIKYTSTRVKPVIEIGSTDLNSEVVFFIKDNGIGFNMKDANRLFGVFERLHSSNVLDGAGMGLSTVQRVVKRHGGRIWAESIEDAGATFYFTLGEPPALQPEQ